MLSPITASRLLALEATRFYTLKSPKPLQPGDTLFAAQRLRFHRSPQDRVFLIGMRGSIQGNPNVEIPNEAWLSSLFFRLWWNDDQDAYTVGTVPDPTSGSLSLTYGWTSYECVFAPLEMTFHPLLRLVRWDDRLWIDIQNRSTSQALTPTMTFAAIREADCWAPGWKGRQQ